VLGSGAVTLPALRGIVGTWLSGGERAPVEAGAAR